MAAQKWATVKEILQYQWDVIKEHAVEGQASEHDGRGTTSAAGHGRNAGKAAVCRGRGSGVDRIPGSRMEGKYNLVQGGRIRAE